MSEHNSNPHQPDSLLRTPAGAVILSNAAPTPCLSSGSFSFFTARLQRLICSFQRVPPSQWIARGPLNAFTAILRLLRLLRLLLLSSLHHRHSVPFSLLRHRYQRSTYHIVLALRQSVIGPREDLDIFSVGQTSVSCSILPFLRACSVLGTFFWMRCLLLRLLLYYYTYACEIQVFLLRLLLLSYLCLRFTPLAQCSTYIIQHRAPNLVQKRTKLIYNGKTQILVFAIHEIISLSANLSLLEATQLSSSSYQRG